MIGEIKLLPNVSMHKKMKSNVPDDYGTFFYFRLFIGLFNKVKNINKARKSWIIFCSHFSLETLPLPTNKWDSLKAI